MKNQLASMLLAAALFAVCGCGPAKPAANNPSEKPAGKDEKIAAALAELAPEDRAVAESQKFCALAETSRLGSMGKPYKITIEDQAVFLCCKGCEKDALANPQDTLAKAEKLRQENGQTK